MTRLRIYPPADPETEPVVCPHCGEPLAVTIEAAPAPPAEGDQGEDDGPAPAS